MEGGGKRRRSVTVRSRHAPPATLHLFLRSFRVGGSDQAQVAVERTNQVVKVLGTVSVARGDHQLGIRTHGTLDVRARVRE